MSSKERLLSKLKDARKNTRLPELTKVLDAFGFEKKRTKDGFQFCHDELQGRMIVNVPNPHGRENKVHTPYVDKCIEAVETLLAIREEKKEKGEQQ